jgi:hypothetical protein
VRLTAVEQVEPLVPVRQLRERDGRAAMSWAAIRSASGSRAHWSASAGAGQQVADLVGVQRVVEQDQQPLARDQRPAESCPVVLLRRIFAPVIPRLRNRAASAPAGSTGRSVS